MEKGKKLQETAIKQENGSLGPYSGTLRAGDVQKMCFQSTDDGPFWITPEEWEQNCKDIIIPSKMKICKYRKGELIRFLKAKGVFTKGFLLLCNQPVNEME